MNEEALDLVARACGLSVPIEHHLHKLPVLEGRAQFEVGVGVLACAASILGRHEIDRRMLHPLLDVLLDFSAVRLADAKQALAAAVVSGDQKKLEKAAHDLVAFIMGTSPGTVAVSVAEPMPDTDGAMEEILGRACAAAEIDKNEPDKE